MKSTNTFAKLLSSVSTLFFLASTSVAVAQTNGLVVGWYDRWFPNDALRYGLPNDSEREWVVAGAPVKITGQVLTDVTAIATSGTHALVLKNGSVIGWGYNHRGQCLGTDSTGKWLEDEPLGQPVQIMGQVLTGVTAIACSWDDDGGTSIAIKDGAVIAWGGGFGMRDLINIPNAAKSGVTAIAASDHYILALKNGGVIGWGWGGALPLPDAANSGVTAIAAGWLHCCALKSGAVLVWDTSGIAEIYGVLNVPDAAKSGVTAIASTAEAVYSLKDGGVIGWGMYYENGNWQPGVCPIPNTAKAGVTAISGGIAHAYALKNGGVIELDNVPYVVSKHPAAANAGVTAIANGINYSIALYDLKDCNQNGIHDPVELGIGIYESDRNGNGILDSCEEISYPSADCNGDGIDDYSDYTDVNFNHIPDSCDVVSGLLNDSNHNGIADSVEVAILESQLAAVRAQLQCGDLDGSGYVDSGDVSVALLNFGPCEENVASPQPQEPMIFPMPEAAKPVVVKK